MKQKITLEKTCLSKKVSDKTLKALSQTTKQLDQVRTTIAKHTANITHLEALLKDCESVDEESSSLGGSVDPEPGAEDPPTAIPQGREDPHDIKMRDVEDNPNPPPPPGQEEDPLPVPAAQPHPPPEDEEDQEDIKDNRDMIVEDERIIIKNGGTTPITLAEDQLLDDQVGTGAETPSKAVTESLSQMNMGSPTAPQVASDPPDEGQDA